MGCRLMKKEVFYCDRCGCEIIEVANVTTMVASLYYILNNAAEKYHRDQHLCPVCGLVFIQTIDKFLKGNKDEQRDSN